MEQNEEPRNKPTLIWSIILGQLIQEYKMRKTQRLQIMVLSWG